MSGETGPTLGDSIRSLRRTDSQGAVAARMQALGHSWHQSTQYKVEAGIRELKFTEAIAMAEVLGVTLDDLAGSKQIDAKLLREQTELRELHELRAFKSAVDAAYRTSGGA